MLSYKQFRDEALANDPELREAYEDLAPVAMLADSLSLARVDRNLTQKELSKLTGISQADISRIESLDGNPSFKTLRRLAKGLGATLRVEFVLEDQDAPRPEEA